MEYGQASRGRGSWMIRAATAALLILGAILAGTVQAQNGIDPAKVFGLFDSNSDGLIDKTEFETNKVIVITAFDSNRNDHLDRDEIMISDENFRAADLDGDGKISGFEFVQSPFGKFETLDADGDGPVTPEEFSAYVARLRS